MAAKADAAVVADQRRDQMLEAAAALIAERGFTDTRIADVARRVGASPALVIYYFGTKDTLLTEALRYSEQSFYAAADEMLASTTSMVERLETLVRLTCVPQTQDEVQGAWGLWFDLWAQAFRHPEVKKDRVELDQRWRSMVARVVHDASRDGEVGKVDAEEFAVAFTALLDGLSIQVALDDPVVDPERAYRIAMRFAAASLGFDWKPSRRRAR
ncbi:MAG TPA: TetR/AcrR family transcriptional regulator [Marmoricola sp.]|jgi:AcrR family transcriptional regulator